MNLDRIAALTERLPEDMDAALVTSGVSRMYLTGMKSSAGTLLITRDAAYFIIDFRYIELARRRVQNARVMLQERLFDQLIELVKKHGLRRIGVESASMTIANYLSMCSVFGEDVLLFDNRLSELLSSMRRYKSREELRVMQQAQDIADRAFARILDFIREGVTEREISLELTRLKYLDGASGDSFENIVASGANSAVPHATPSDKPVAKGDFVTMDFGAVLDGYASDMTRTVAIGEADEEKRAVYDTVLKAQRAAFDVIAPGVPCKAVDAAARELINAAGYEGCFGHGLGHSLGLQVHEEPRFSPMDTSVCEPGLVMSVEPGVYLEGRFGCRIEDVVCITEQGFVNLARSPKELLVL